MIHIAREICQSEGHIDAHDHSQRPLDEEEPLPTLQPPDSIHSKEPCIAAIEYH